MHAVSWVKPLVATMPSPPTNAMLASRRTALLVDDTASDDALHAERQHDGDQATSVAVASCEASAAVAGGEATVGLASPNRSGQCVPMSVAQSKVSTAVAVYEAKEALTKESLAKESLAKEAVRKAMAMRPTRKVPGAPDSEADSEPSAAVESNPRRSSSSRRADDPETDGHATTDGEFSNAGDTACSDTGSDSSAAAPIGDAVADWEVASVERQINSDWRACKRRQAQQRVAPKTPFQGERVSSTRNACNEVGNFGLFFGNWGARGSTVLGPAGRKTVLQDRQILKSPGQVMVIAESSRLHEDMLKQLPQAALPDDPQSRLEGSPTKLAARSTCEWFVQRGNEEKNAVMIASRTDVTSSLVCLHYENHGHPYREKSKDKSARSRIMVCEVGFKQNIGHLGKKVVVCGVHGHYKTMKREWPTVFDCFWDGVALQVQAHNIDFMAGDFNMSLTEVPKQLNKRGIKCDCVAWYPWRRDAQGCGLEGAPGDFCALWQGSDQKLGFDSCGIFFIGGMVEVRMNWSFWHIETLAAVADDSLATAVANNGMELDVYRGANVPGQFWTAYRSTKYKESMEDKNLQDRLTDLLTPSTTWEELQTRHTPAGKLAASPRHPNGKKDFNYCQWLKTKQKQLDVKEWLVDGEVHNGAHFPLLVFTNNESGRSQASDDHRAKGKKGMKGSGSGKGKRGSGKGTAVAEVVTPGQGDGTWPYFDRQWRTYPSASSNSYASAPSSSSGQWRADMGSVPAADWSSWRSNWTSSDARSAWSSSDAWSGWRSY